MVYTSSAVVQIRVASENDVPDMHRIRMSVRENRLLDPARVQPADYGPMLTRDGRGWVAELDHQVVGFAIADLSHANIWALFVNPDHEGRGVGRALHDAMMAWVFASGPERVSLTTDPGTRAERFYQAAGWRHVGTEHGESRYELCRQDWTRRR
jgi:GNAT superfamily N-acetyltransferase